MVPYNQPVNQPINPLNEYQTSRHLTNLLKPKAIHKPTYQLYNERKQTHQPNREINHSFERTSNQQTDKPSNWTKSQKLTNHSANQNN